VRDDGTAELGPLTVATGNWSSDSRSIPVDLLCGTTVIAVRAFAPGHGAVPAFRFLASTYMLASTPDCP
ncbi:MAG: hypothetical protein JWO36_6772, partial [Myxococcales bacterium]|nr:hypothetical protein [Myxococcales bacterium]